MKKLKLGTIPSPERYYPAGKDCLLANSVEAYDFFKDFFDPHGLVILGKATFASLSCRAILIWIYFDSKKQKVLSLVPMFVSDFKNAQKLKLLSIELFEHEIFFFKENELYSSVFTSTGQTEILKVRSILSLNEFSGVLQLEGQHNVTDIYPVKVYNTADNSFLATCWAYITDQNFVYFKPVCDEDIQKLDKVEDDLMELFPIDFGDTAVIGGDYYILRYTSQTGSYFEKTFQFTDKPFHSKKKN